jgi:hypothetical protein
MRDTLTWHHVPRSQVNADVHACTSAALVIESARRAGSGAAAVLGCGGCDDVPLAWLTGRFSRLDFVDIDADALTRLEAVAGSRRPGSWTFHPADLTGLIDRVEAAAREIIGRVTDPLACLRALGSLLDSTTPSFWTPPGGDRYAFIVCATVLTQLQASVRERVESLFLDRYPGASALFADERWQAHVWQFARALEDTFIMHLDSLLDTGGVVFLSDTVHVSWLKTVDARTFAVEGRWIATRTAHLADYLRPWHTLLSEHRWSWFRQAREGPFWGRLYGVQAVTYRPSTGHN